MTTQAEASSTQAAPPAESSPGAEGAVVEQQKPAAPVRTLADADTELASTKQALQKAQSDLKSALGRNKPADEIRALREIVTGLKSDMGVYTGILKSLAPEEAARIEAELTAAQGRSQINDYFREQMDAAVFNDDGNLALPADAPEMETLTRAYATASAMGTDATGIKARMNAIRLAALTVRSYQAGQTSAQVEAKEKELQEAITKAEKRGEEKAKAAYVAKVEVAPGGVNGGGGGVAPTKDNIDTLYLQGKVSGDVYRKFLETGSI